MFRQVTCLLIIVSSVAVGAAPAPWYVWKSKTAAHVICLQTNPGEGWQKLTGPFTSSQCGKYLKELKIDTNHWQLEPKYKPLK